MYKLFTGIIHGRIQKITEKEIGEYQGGFRAERRTTDHLFTIRQITEKHFEHDVDLHLLFVDFRSAFDSINRKILIETIVEMKIPAKLIKLTVMTLSQTRSLVKIGNRKN